MKFWICRPDLEAKNPYPKVRYSDPAENETDGWVRGFTTENVPGYVIMRDLVERLANTPAHGHPLEARVLEARAIRDALRAEEAVVAEKHGTREP
jgi:hypothetical protein